MHLIFDGKKSIRDILDEVNNFRKIENDKQRKDLREKINNSLLFGDNCKSLDLLLNNGYSGEIDLTYIDPPFGTGSIFRDTSDSGSSVSTSKNANIAYDDSIVEDEFLAFMWERFIKLYELLSNEGTLYVHIGLKYSAHFRLMLNEIFGESNFVNEIARIKSNPKNFSRKGYGNNHDTVLVYAKNKDQMIFNQIEEQMDFAKKNSLGKALLEQKFPKIEYNDGKSARRYTTVPVHAPGETKDGVTGKTWYAKMQNGDVIEVAPPKGRHWRQSPEKLEKLNQEGRIEWSGNNNPRLKKYADEHPGTQKIQDTWLNFKDSSRTNYPTQKNSEMLDMIVQQSSNENSIVLDIFAGSGSTLISAKKNGRTFIGMDNSELAKSVIKNNIEEIEIFDIDELISKMNLPLNDSKIDEKTNEKCLNGNISNLRRIS